MFNNVQKCVLKIVCANSLLLINHQQICSLSLWHRRPPSSSHGTQRQSGLAEEVRNTISVEKKFAFQGCQVLQGGASTPHVCDHTWKMTRAAVFYFSSCCTYVLAFRVVYVPMARNAGRQQRMKTRTAQDRRLKDGRHMKLNIKQDWIWY